MSAGPRTRIVMRRGRYLLRFGLSGAGHQRRRNCCLRRASPTVPAPRREWADRRTARRPARQRDETSLAQAAPVRWATLVGLIDVIAVVVEHHEVTKASENSGNADALENAEDLPEEVSSVAQTNIAGAGFEPATFGL